MHIWGHWISDSVPLRSTLHGSAPRQLQLNEDLQALKTRIEKGHLKTTPKIHEAVGRLKERYPRVARYYRMEYEEEQKFSWQEDLEKKAIAEKLDGSYLFKTDRQDDRRRDLAHLHAADATHFGVVRLTVMKQNQIPDPENSSAVS
jgi:hypothetical protein